MGNTHCNCGAGGWVDRAALPAVVATAFDSLQLDQDTVVAKQKAEGRREAERGTLPLPTLGLTSETRAGDVLSSSRVLHWHGPLDFCVRHVHFLRCLRRRLSAVASHCRKCISSALNENEIANFTMDEGCQLRQVRHMQWP